MTYLPPPEPPTEPDRPKISPNPATWPNNMKIIAVALIVVLLVGVFSVGEDDGPPERARTGQTGSSGRETAPDRPETSLDLSQDEQKRLAEMAAEQVWASTSFSEQETLCIGYLALDRETVLTEIESGMTGDSPVDKRTLSLALYAMLEDNC